MSTSPPNYQDFVVTDDLLGKGTFGTVQLIHHQGQAFARKDILLEGFNDYQIDMVNREIRILCGLSHPNIVKYYDHFLSTDKRYMHIVTEFCELGDLGRRIVNLDKQNLRFPEEDIWTLAYNISKALRYCHEGIQSTTILHRDVKPANILINAKGQLKLADFGLSKDLDHNALTGTNCGSLVYKAPEIIKGEEYGCRADVWSLGVTLYQATNFYLPFNVQGLKPKQVEQVILTQDLLPFRDGYSGSLQHFICKLLTRNPSERPSIADAMKSSRLLLEARAEEYQQAQQRMMELKQLNRQQKQEIDKLKRELSMYEDRGRKLQRKESQLSLKERQLRRQSTELKNSAERIQETMKHMSLDIQKMGRDWDSYMSE